MVRSGLLAAALPASLVVTWAVLVVPGSTAHAQPGDDAGGGSGSEVELDEDPAPADGDETGSEENPDAPLLGTNPEEDGPKAPVAKKTGYPIAEIERPITLPDFTSEVRLDLRLFPDPLDVEFGLRARYGITRQAQVGVRYNIGGFYEDGKPNAADDKATFNTGKAVALEFQYLVTEWVAPRVTIPMYVDPFAIGMTLGAQMKFRFGKLAFVGLEDVVGFKLSDKFVPDLENERANEAAADSLVINEINSDGFIRIDGGVVYQLKPNMAVSGRFGVTFNDFADDKGATALRVNVQFTPKKMIDLIGQVGFNALDDYNSFNLGGALAVRI